MEEEKESKLFLVFSIVMFLIAFAIFWHPWINQDSASKAFEKFYDSNLFEIKLTKWNPYGHDFEIYTFTGKLIGRGSINIFGEVTRFNFVWEEV